MLADSVHLVSTKQEGKKVKLLGYQLSKVTPVTDVPAPVYVHAPDESGYQGWKNYQTWATKLWLDNEEWSYEEATNHAYEMVIAGTPHSDYEMADWLDTFVDTHILSEVPDSGLAADLFRSATDDIDWMEIAKSYMSDARDQRIEELKSEIDGLKDEIVERQVEVSEKNDEIVFLNLSE